ncbi:hypothetical protein R3Q16_33865 [Rhodococcus globerulus]|uniref:Uncharacterized protein n=1 Tax=Rhodococcus globerulus TaxID=33008 RepID=A0ABU4C5N8_RHOGO|nr:hypothetical protein [Rhodococcus globerulus]MDV6271584.1 hypothetical protein [Rhodococcus globerulus]
MQRNRISGHSMLSTAQAYRMTPMSNPALCATTMSPAMKSTMAGRASFHRGAVVTISRVMP